MAQVAPARTTRETPSALPRSAYEYAIKELARRAGVDAEFFRTWRIVFEGNWIRAVVDSNGSTIRFPVAGEEFHDQIRAGTFKTSTMRRMRESRPLNSPVSDFRVPFSSALDDAPQPLFRAAAQSTIDCSLDLPASVFLTLSRFEETLPGVRDAHGRFSAFSSVAWRDGFLNRPVVDEYGLAIAEALQYLLPNWKPSKLHFRATLGHDVDEIGLPFNVRNVVAHTIRRGQPAASLRDCVSPVIGIDTNYQLLLKRAVMFSLQHGLKPAVYWKASRRGLHDTGYDPRHPAIRAMISEFQSYGLEMGVHPGYQSFQSPDILRAEIAILRSVLGEEQIGGRQDFLRWTPATWELWEHCGLAYDASVGYADHIGFRAGTCHPFRPWVTGANRESDLLEIPLLAMDSTLQSYMKLAPEQAMEALRDCINRCRAVGGVFTIVWHTTKSMQSDYARVYRFLIEELSGSPSYDGRTPDHDVY